jgi:hypothetical protein
MLEVLADLPVGIDGVKAVGKVSKDDYERVIEPMMDAARREGRRLRFLYEIGPDFDGFTAGAAWEDAKVGLRSIRLFDGCAVVTDIGWIRDATRLAAFMMPCPVRVFAYHDRGAAIQWLLSISAEPAVVIRMIPTPGVMVVEVRAPFQSEDFDALALTADTWIEAHGALHGLVIHAQEFPGWKNLGAVLRHITFVRDYHHRIERVAIAVDSKLASWGPRLGEHFVHAEIKSFSFNELEDAIAWASATPAG